MSMSFPRGDVALVVVVVVVVVEDCSSKRSFRGRRGK
jgi:hypothetical protein